MIDYKPDYDTTIQKRVQTRTESLPTIHRDGIDWSYPFDAPEHTQCMCSSEEVKREHIEKLKAWLRLLESDVERAWASTYGGWPRIWHKVHNVCMASCWPYWKPRPTVIYLGTLGVEYHDWTSLTGAELRDAAIRNV